MEWLIETRACRPLAIQRSYSWMKSADVGFGIGAPTVACTLSLTTSAHKGATVERVEFAGMEESWNGCSLVSLTMPPYTTGPGETGRHGER